MVTTYSARAGEVDLPASVLVGLDLLDLLAVGRRSTVISTPSMGPLLLVWSVPVDASPLGLRDAGTTPLAQRRRQGQHEQHQDERSPSASPAARAGPVAAPGPDRRPCRLHGLPRASLDLPGRMIEDGP